MTAKEAIDILELHCPFLGTDKNLTEAIDMAIKALTAQQWIPCGERLPEVGEDVLFSVGGVYVAEGCLREDGGWSQFRWQAIQRKESVTAWMPLPEPWKGEEDG